jgi:methionine-gamma-lyase
MKKISFNSICAKEIQDPKTSKPHILPLYATSSYVFEDTQFCMDVFAGKEKAHVYSRYGNPTIDAVANKIAALESYNMEDKTAQAYLTSSGMSAIFTVLSGLLQQGDKVLTQGNLYGGTTELLLKIFKKLGVEPIFIDLKDQITLEQNLTQDPAIKLIYLETPANPTLACIDLDKLSATAQAHKIITVIDNTFATPYLQQPLSHGIDIVIHSTTKYLNGHGNSIAGAIITANEDYAYQIWTALKLTGGNCSPWDAWLLHNGLKTLPLRMERHCNNALNIARFLDEHKKVITTNYPGLAEHSSHDIASHQMNAYGGMLSFELAGGLEAGIRFLDNLKFCTQAPTLGDIDTLVLHPASSSHIKVAKPLREANGITDGLVRISVGIEDVLDIINDLEQAIG